ncbi:MAG: NUDIX domain-containing protein [Candidatus Algichlamydia australiensis]|nr:NUDIX domain-containing protein [Chlamydiales bacterium]
MLVRRRDIPVYVPPGGGIDPGEEPEQAALREAIEETGVDVKILRKVGEYTPKNRLAQNTHVFEGRVEKENLTATNETLGAKFFPLTGLPEPMAPPHLEWIHEAKASLPLIQREIRSVSYFQLLRGILLYPKITCLFLLTKLGIHFNKSN